MNVIKYILESIILKSAKFLYNLNELTIKIIMLIKKKKMKITLKYNVFQDQAYPQFDE